MTVSIASVRSGDGAGMAAARVRRRIAAWLTGALGSFRALVLLGGLILAVFAALCGVFLMQAYEETRVSAQQSAMNLAQAMSRDVTRNIEIYDLALQDTAAAIAHPEIAGLPPPLRQLVLFHRSSTDRYLGATILVDTQGVVTDRSDDSKLAINVADRDYFTYHRDHPDDPAMRVSAPFVSRVDGEPSVALSRVILAPGGGFGGVVACVVRLEYFRSLFEQIDVGRHGLIALMNANGTLLMRKPLDLSKIGADVSAITRHFSPSGGGTFMARSPLDGLDRAYVYQRAANAPLVTLIGTSGLDVFQAWQRKAWALAISLFVLSGAGALIVVLLRREMRRRNDAEQERQQSEARFRLLAERSSDAIVLRDADGVRLYASPSFYRLIGWPPEVIGQRKLVEFIHPDDRSVLSHTIPRLTRNEDSVNEVFRCQRQDGHWLWLEGRTAATFDANGAIVNLISNLRDISEQKAAEDELASAAARFEVLATTDKLTGLANRHRFDERLDQEWRRAQRHGAPVALLMLDADNFKAFNDRYGHQRGDAVLQAIATCIVEGQRRPSDLGARYGGEEFAVLLPETSEAQALMLAERIRDAVSALAIPHAGSPLDHVTISIGAACLRPHEALGSDALIADADAALYCAKRQGKNRCIGMAQARLAPAPEALADEMPAAIAAPAPDAAGPRQAVSAAA